MVARQNQVVANSNNKNDTLRPQKICGCHNFIAVQKQQTAHLLDA